MKIEDEILEKIILDIESSNFNTVKKRSENETFELWRDSALLENLSGNIGALFVRAILSKLNIDEHYIFRWRLENKYRQFQILNHYVPGCMAETIGLSNVLSTDIGVQKIRELCANGFFIKSTLGDRSGQNNNFDRTDELNDIVKSNQKEYFENEKWMLQKRLKLTEEFRIHTFGKDLIHGLTFIMNNPESSESLGAEQFVEKILEKLPHAILQGTLIGWDIGITETNEYYVIEANFTGFHPEFSRGFQTSGYFGDRHYGSILCAWLNNYFRIKYHISIDSIESDLLLSNQFYKEFVYFDSLFKREHIGFRRNTTVRTGVSAIIYLGDEIDSLMIRLINYFQLENFADQYYLIINKKNMMMANDLFSASNQINILIEDELFTKDQYALIELLNYERRKKLSSYHALRIIKDESYFMI